jgi:hypothetical protein
VFFFQSPLGLVEALGTRAGDRALLLGAALVEPLLGLAQPPAPAWAVENSRGSSSPRRSP